MTPAETRAYVLMTPARNEEDNVQRVLETVAAQTVLPMRWVIVDDGSTDRTAERVDAFSKNHDFVSLIRREHGDDRTFASKANALREAYESMAGLDFRFIGNLDADIALPADYYEGMLAELDKSPDLGLAGGTIHDVVGDELICHKSNLNSVAGAVQLFRREVYEAIGGYKPCETGGVDTVAEVCTRMHGWRVQTFPEWVVRHHRGMGRAVHGTLESCWRVGRKDYMLGYHPLFYLLMSTSRLFESPFIVGGTLRWCAYCWYWVRGRRPAQSNEFVGFLRNEQLARLRSALRLHRHS